MNKLPARRRGGYEHSISISIRRGAFQRSASINDSINLLLQHQHPSTWHRNRD